MPGESHGQRSLAGYRPWGHKESDTTEVKASTHAGILEIMAFATMWMHIETVILSEAKSSKEEEIYDQLPGQRRGG